MEFIEAFADFIQKIIEMITNLVETIRGYNDKKDEEEKADL